MPVVLIRLAFIKIVQTCFLLLIPFFLVQSSRGETGFVTSRFLESLPMLAFGLAGGILVDRVGASRINRFALLAYIVPPLLLVAVYLKYIPAACLLLASLAVSSTSQLLMACGDRIVLDIVSRTGLAAYNGNAILIERFCSLGLPVLIGSLAVWSLEAALALTTTIAALGSVGLFMFSPRAVDHTVGLQNVSLRTQLKAGFSGLAENRFLLHLSFITMLINGIEAIPISFAFLYGHDVLHMNLAEIGLLSTMSGLGGLIAATFARKLRGTKNLLLGILIASMLLNAAIYALVYILNDKYMLWAGKLVEAFSFVFSAVSYRTLRQESIGKTFYGTISAAVGFTVKLCIPPAILVAGALLIHFSPRDLYLFAALAESLLAIAVAFWAKSQSIPANHKVYI